MGIDLITSLLLQYKYAIMFPAALLFGPFVALTSGFLARLEYLELFPTLFVIVGAMLTGDLLWYWVGRRWGDSFADQFGKYVGITKTHIATAKQLFHDYHTSILFASKITSGLGFSIVILFTAGLSRVPLLRYILVNAIGEILWSGSLVAIGFFFSNWYLSVNTALERMSVIGIVLLFIACLIGSGIFLRSRFIAKYEQRGES